MLERLLEVPRRVIDYVQRPSTRYIQKLMDRQKVLFAKEKVKSQLFNNHYRAESSSFYEPTGQVVFYRDKGEAILCKIKPRIIKYHNSAVDYLNRHVALIPEYKKIGKMSPDDVFMFISKHNNDLTDLYDGYYVPDKRLDDEQFMNLIEDFLLPYYKNNLKLMYKFDVNMYEKNPKWPKFQDITLANYFRLAVAADLYNAKSCENEKLEHEIIEFCWKYEIPISELEEIIEYEIIPEEEEDWDEEIDNYDIDDDDDEAQSF